jgi:PAS domain S-box-containing protein
MKTHPYAGAAKYSIAGFLLGVVIIVIGFYFGENGAANHPLLELSAYDKDFIILLFSPLYLGLIFAALGLRKQKYIETQLTVHQESLNEQTMTNAVDVHNRLLGKIVAQVNEGIIITDAEGNVQWINSGVTNTHGYSLNEMIGQQMMTLLPAEPGDKFVALLKEKMSSGIDFTEELLTLHKNGSSVWLYISVKAIFDDSGKLVNLISVQKDINNRKQRELAIQKLESELITSNRKLYQAMRLANLGSWELDRNNNLTLSPELRQMLKVTASRVVSLRDIANSIPGTDLRKIRKAMADCKTSPYPIEVEYCIVADNKKRYMVSNINPGFNENDEFTGFFGTVQDVTSARKAAIALKKSEAEKAGIINNTQTIICLHDMKGCLIDINPAAEKASGYLKEEVRGINLRLLISPDFQHAFDGYINEVRATGKAAGTLQIVTKSGIKRIWHYQNSVYSGEGGKKYIIASAIDVTESVKAQHEIERQEQFIRQIIDNSPNVIFMLNEQREIVLANRTFANFYPYNQAETPVAATLSRGPEDMFLGDIDGLFQMTDEEVRQSEGSILNKTTNTVFRFSVINKCFTDKKGKKIILGFGMDVTKKFQIETDLIAANQLVEKSLKVKDQFISNMSHEIRTPLNAIIGFTDLLSETALDTRQNDFLDIVKTASSNLLGIINNILDLSKIESSNLVLESVPFKLKKGLNDVVKILESKAKIKGLQVVTEYDEKLPEQVIGDQLRLNQILFNLISNAIKFTDTGKIEIICKAAAGPDPLKKYISFSVIDTGIGVPKDKQSQIFERFTQANTNTQRLYGGTGLGLNIAQSIVELYKGTITIESEVGKGTAFHVLLPFDYSSEPNQPAEPVKVIKPLAVASTLTESIHILLAEDNLVNATLAKEVLTKRGFTLRHVQNGALAVECLQQEHFDLVLMDIQMPVMNGIDAAMAIRNLTGPVSQIPIIAMTAHSLHGEMTNCYNSGMNGYVAKPFKAAELFDSIFELVTKKEAV